MSIPDRYFLLGLATATGFWVLVSVTISAILVSFAKRQPAKDEDPYMRWHKDL